MSSQHDIQSVGPSSKTRAHLCLLLLLLACTVTLLGASESTKEGSLIGIANAFLATYAKANIEWKKEITFSVNPNNLKPGHQLGVSKVAGYFSFAPKTWDDLSAEEQRALLQDQRLQAFIISLRESNQAPPDAAGQRVAGTTGRPLYPVDGVTLERVAGTAKKVQPKTNVVKIDLTPEMLLGKEPVVIKSFQ